MKRLEILAAVFMGAGLWGAWAAEEMEEVERIQAVGYVNTSLVPGLNLISNPLNNRAENGNTLTNLFHPERLRVGTKIFLPGPDGFDVATLETDGIGGRSWTPLEMGMRILEPGEGCFVELAGTENLTVVFVGQIAEGVLTNTLPAGLSIKSSIVPQAGSVAVLGFVPMPGDMIYRLEAGSGRYQIYSFDDLTLEWRPEMPQMRVGEAFWLRTAVGRDWVRSFRLDGGGSGN